MLDSEKIRAFLTVMQFGSISEAADALFIAQPTLTYRIQMLEAELGQQLFKRKQGNRTVELTAMGHKFFPLAEKISANYAEIYTLSDSISNQKLHIGGVDSLNSILFPTLMTKLLHDLPPISIDLITLWYYDIYKKIVDFSLDIGFVTRKTYAQSTLPIPIFEEKMFLVHAQNSKKYAAINHPKYLDSADEIYLNYGDTFNAWHEKWFNVKGEPRIVIDKTSLIEPLLNYYDLWVIAPASVVQYFNVNERLVVKSMLQPPPPRITYLLKNKVETPLLAEIWTPFAASLNAYLQENAKLLNLQLLAQVE